MSGGTERVLVSVARGIAHVTLNRPDKRNAMDALLVEQLKSTLRALDADDGVRVIALGGAGKDFCSGVDLAGLARLADAPVLDNLADADALADLFILLRRVRHPVVALVHGRALAGGCGLATACDLVLAADDASFGYPEVKVGFVPAMVTAMLRRSVPEKRAFELIALGEVVGAAEAERLGLVNRVFAASEFRERGEEYLRELAARSATAVRMCKRLLHHQDAMPFETAVRAGADLNVLARMTDEMRAGVERFLERKADR
ncbi:MAG TPA: enoyl-CoA hydratase-related protein [Longimicrobiaceae bacterium]|nr:enoyl-CoA hydratase-related protein [Longimicrobiaceae bacterium]